MLYNPYLRHNVIESIFKIYNENMNNQFIKGKVDGTIPVVVWNYHRIPFLSILALHKLWYVYARVALPQLYVRS